MKKYISLLNLIAAFLMLSCDRSESIVEPEGKTTEITSHREAATEENNIYQENNDNNLEKGDEEEPKKDKQHWRTVNDTVK